MVLEISLQYKPVNYSLKNRYTIESLKRKMPSKLKHISSPSNTSLKPKTVLFYKNGDRNFRGYHISITERRFNSFQNLLNELTRVTNLAQGARYIFTPTTGTRIESLDELTDGQSYVFGSYPKLKKINYEHAPDGSDRKQGRKPFIQIPPTKLYTEKDLSHSSIRPRVITVIRNTLSLVRQKRCIKILLNKRTAQTFDQVLNDITSSVGIEGLTGVRKLFNLDGKLVLSLSELFGEEDIFIAVGSEKFQQSDLHAILQTFGIDRSKKKNNINDMYIPSMITSSPPLMKANLKSSKIETSNKFHPRDSKVADSSKVYYSSKEIFKTPKLPEIKKEIKKSKYLQSTVHSSLKNHQNGNKSIHEHVILDLSDDDLQNEVNEEEKASLEICNINLEKPSIIFEDQKLISNLNKNIIETSDKSSDLSERDERSNFREEDEKLNILEEKDKYFQQFSAEMNKKDKSQYFEHEKHSYVISDHKDIELYFDLGKQLGDGNFAVVKEAFDKKTNTKFAIKIIDASKIKDRQEMLDNEIKIQRESSHPNIVRLFCDFRSPTAIFLTMELITGGDLFDLISESGCFEEDEAAPFVRDLCSGLDYLHKRDIVHRDIKPENLMVMVTATGQQILKIADFGLAMKVEQPIYTICGTPTYVAPEILSEKGYGVQVDIWAAGVIIYIMLCGFPPFRSENKKQTELFDLIEKGEYEFPSPYWNDVSETAKDLISKILIVNVKERYSALDILSHSWITQHRLLRNATHDSMDRRGKTMKFRIVAETVRAVERFKHFKRDESFINFISESKK